MTTLYHLHMILLDKDRKGKPIDFPYGISCEPVLQLKEAFEIIKKNVDSANCLCCSAYIVEETIDHESDTDTKRIIYAENYVSIAGGYYYPDVKCFGSKYNIEERMKHCIM